MNADRDILADVVAMHARLGQLQLVNSLVLSKCCRVLRKRRSEHPDYKYYVTGLKLITYICSTVCLTS